MTFMVLLDSYMLVLLHSLVLRVVVSHLISPRRLEWCVIFFFSFAYEASCMAFAAITAYSVQT